MRRIELITCRVDQLEAAKAQHPHAPVFDARILPDPSEEVGDLFGTDPTVGEEIRRQGRKALSLAKKTVLEHIYHCHDTIIIFHEGGWHRSVALAEIVKDHLIRWPVPKIGVMNVVTTHMGAQVK